MDTRFRLSPILDVSCKSRAHLFWNVTTADGTDFVMDLSAAQFGHRAPVTPMDQYRMILSFDVHETHQLGHFRTILLPDVKRKMAKESKEFLLRMIISTRVHQILYTVSQSNTGNIQS